MSKYSIVDITTYDTLEEALAEAEKRWRDLTDEQKAKRDSFDIFSSPDEDKEFNLAFADVVKAYKE